MKQQGYAMLLLLPALLAVTVSISIFQPSVNNKHARQLQVLAETRQQLIAYSASYLESYKPTGAGPGHLPCPDTDQSPDAFRVQAGLRGDGPNPPCGRHAIAVGKLPRHISTGKNRYAFHLEDKHALWYAVDTRFINNPINRIVNPDTVGRIELVGAQPAAAVIFIPRFEAPIWAQVDSVVSDSLREALQGRQAIGGFEDAVSQYTLIMPESLLEAVTQRIALWMGAQYQTSNLFACVVGSECGYAAVLNCALPVRDKTMLLLLKANNSLDCDGTLTDVDRANQFISDSKLESVYLFRHWFYRNDWWNHVDIQIADACVEALIVCYANVQATLNKPPITLHVQPL